MAQHPNVKPSHKSACNLGDLASASAGGRRHSSITSTTKQSSVPLPGESNTARRKTGTRGSLCLPTDADLKHLSGPHDKPDIGKCSMSGNRYGTANQDYCVCQELYANGEIPKSGQQCYVVSVTDGHGILGEKSAVLAGKALARHIFSGFLRNKNLVRMEEADVVAEILAAFKKAHKAALSLYDHPPKTVSYPGGGPKHPMATFEFKASEDGRQPFYQEQGGRRSEKMLEFGCTCTAAIIQGTCVYLADVGDSAAVLGYKDEEGQYHGDIVTVRHYGKYKEEAERIRRDHASTTRVLEDGYVQAIEGTPIAGYELSVTRALGHKHMQEYGVTPEPHVTMLKLEEKKHCCLVLASDGVWDVMHADAVVQLVMEAADSGLRATDAAKVLVEKCVSLGLAGPKHEQDNTSAVVSLF